MDSPSASPAKTEYPVCSGTADEAGPCPRFVTSEELHILQTCLTRWRTEVEQDIKGLVVIYTLFYLLIYTGKRFHLYGRELVMIIDICHNRTIIWHISNYSSGAIIAACGLP